MSVPEGKPPLQDVEQLTPAGELTTVPLPLPEKSTTSVTPEKQTTLAVIVPVTIAPDDVIPPALVLV